MPISFGKLVDITVSFAAQSLTLAEIEALGGDEANFANNPGRRRAIEERQAIRASANAR
jgi:hypothetical protein